MTTPPTRLAPADALRDAPATAAPGRPVNAPTEAIPVASSAVTAGTDAPLPADALPDALGVLALPPGARRVADLPAWRRHLWDIAAAAVLVAAGAGVGLLVARRPASPAGTALSRPADSTGPAPGAAPPSSPAQPAAVAAAGGAPGATPAGTTPDAGTPAGTPPDWADSVPVPAWVVNPSGSAPGVSHSYVRLGGGTRDQSYVAEDEAYRRAYGAAGPSSPGGSGAGAAGAPVTGAAARPAARVVDWTTVAPILVQRVASSKVVGRPLGYGTNAALGADGATAWAVLGRCGTPLSFDGAPDVGPQAGRELGRLSDWIFALAVPEAACGAVTPHAPGRSAPTGLERRSLAFAATSSGLVRGLGAPEFSEGDLKDFAIYGASSGRYVWGVFRRGAQGTQLYPPPPEPKLAFVAHSADGERWQILWAKYADAAGELVTLAGTYAPPGTALPTGFFVVRAPDGSGRLLKVAADASGAWRLTGTQPF